MKNKNIIFCFLAGTMVTVLFVMCSKSEKTLNLASTQNSGTTGVTGPSSISHIVQPADWMVDGTTISPGDSIYIPSGNRGALLLKNLKGTAAAPIIIINKNGKVTFTATLNASYAFKTQNCQYFKIIGNGDAAVKYGFDINGGNIGMTMDDLSSDFEIANVEVRNTGFAGIMAKTDPSCDAATWRGHFTMKNVLLHDNYVHKTGGEGFYVGNSFYAGGVTLSCGTEFPHDVVNVKIFKNRTDSTGCEGIQVGSATLGCEIYSNTVENPGLTPFANGQDNGIQIGEGTGGKCYNNLIRNSPGNGIIVLGLGDNLVFNNLILNPKTYGIFADSRYTPGPDFQFINNTIINAALGGIKLDSETIPMNTVINNVIIVPLTVASIITKSSAVKLTANNNYVNADINTCKFQDYSSDNFHLLPLSPLINAGANVASYGINFDYYNTPRSTANGSTIGAITY